MRHVNRPSPFLGTTQRYLDPRWASNLHLCVDETGELPQFDIGNALPTYIDHSPRGSAISIDDAVTFTSWMWTVDGYGGRLACIRNDRGGQPSVNAPLSSFNPATHTSLSFCCWYYPETLGDYAVPIGAGVTANAYAVYATSSGGAIARVDDGAASEVTGGVLALNTWRFFAVTWDGANVLFWQDGALVGITAAAGAPGIANGGHWRFPGGFEDTGNTQKGSTRYAMVWKDRVLTASDIYDLSRNPSPFMEGPTNSGILQLPIGSVALAGVGSVATIGLSGLKATQDGAALGTLPVFAIGDFVAAGETTILGAAGTYDRDISFPGFAVLLDTGDEDRLPYAHLFGYKFSSDAQGLMPRGSGNVGEFLCGDGTFRRVGGFSELALLETPTDQTTDTNSTFTAGVDETPNWTVETHDAGVLHATDDEFLIIVTSGTYLFGAQIRIIPSQQAVGTMLLKLYRQRAAVDVQVAEWYSNFTVGGSNTISCDTLIDCLADDKLFVKVQYAPSGAETPSYTLPASLEHCNLYVARVK